MIMDFTVTPACSGRLDGGAAPSGGPGVAAGPGPVRAVSFQPHGQRPDPRPEPDHNRHLHHAGGRARGYDPADERPFAGRHHRSELPDVPPRLLTGPRHDLPGRPGAGQRLREHLGEPAWPAAVWWHVRGARVRSASPNIRLLACGCVAGLACGCVVGLACGCVVGLACGCVAGPVCGPELVVVGRRGIGHREPADRRRVGQRPALVGWPAQVGHERQHRRPQRCWGRRPMAGGRGWLRHVMSCTPNR